MQLEAQETTKSGKDHAILGVGNGLGEGCDEERMRRSPSVLKTK